MYTYIRIQEKGRPKHPPKIPKYPKITAFTHRNTPKTPRSRELFRKVRANFCLLPCDAGQESDGNCPEKLVHMNFFSLGGYFRMDFPPLRERERTTCITHMRRLFQNNACIRANMQPNTSISCFLLSSPLAVLGLQDVSET